MYFKSIVQMCFLMPLTFFFVSGCQSLDKSSNHSGLIMNHKKAYQEEMDLAYYFWQLGQHKRVSEHLKQTILIRPNSENSWVLLRLNNAQRAQFKNLNRQLKLLSPYHGLWSQAVKVILNCRRSQNNQIKTQLKAFYQIPMSQMPWMIWQGLAQCQCKIKWGRDCHDFWHNVYVYQPNNKIALIELARNASHTESLKQAIYWLSLYNQKFPPTVSLIQIEEKIANREGQHSNAASLILLENALSSGDNIFLTGGHHGTH